MPNSLNTAIERAQTRLGSDHWLWLSPRERTAAIYHEMCRIDSGCQRTGTAADMLLPPCAATAEFVRLRACKAARPGGQEMAQAAE